MSRKYSVGELVSSSESFRRAAGHGLTIGSVDVQPDYFSYPLVTGVISAECQVCPAEASMLSTGQTLELAALALFVANVRCENVERPSCPRGYTVEASAT